MLESSRGYSKSHSQSIQSVHRTGSNSCYKEEKKKTAILMLIKNTHEFKKRKAKEM
jgi:hypothetical protein